MFEAMMKPKSDAFYALSRKFAFVGIFAIPIVLAIVLLWVYSQEGALFAGVVGLFLLYPYLLWAVRVCEDIADEATMVLERRAQHRELLSAIAFARNRVIEEVRESRLRTIEEVRYRTLKRTKKVDFHGQSYWRRR